VIYEHSDGIVPFSGALLTLIYLQIAAAEASPVAKTAEPPAEAIESPSQMAASDRIEDSDKEGAAKAPQPIAGVH